MEKFKIAIEETCVQHFDIIANSPEEAIEIAKEKYRKSDIILDNCEVHFKQLSLVDATEWIEF